MDWRPEADMNYADKQALLRDYWDRYGPFPYVIETGIWRGQGSCMQFKSDETEYVAVEIDRQSAEHAWANGFDVRVGDSGELLPGILAARDGPAFIWLDAHAVVEAGEADSSPLLAEVDAVAGWRYAGQSVVLVDDVRMMRRDGWPNLRDVLERLYVRPGLWDMTIAGDILRLTPWRPLTSRKGMVS